jgi:branched-chain amino acid aminotransferase
MKFEEKGLEKVWLDGDLIDWRDAQLHPLAHTAQYGSMAFEGMRCYDTPDGPAVFRHPAHYERFEDSTDVIGIDLDYSVTELMAATRDVIEFHGWESCYIRPMAYYGLGGPGVSAYEEAPEHVLISAWPRGRKWDEANLDTGLKASISSWRRTHSSQFPTTAKIGGLYLNSLLAIQDAKPQGFDESIRLDIEGNVAEGYGANIFLVEDGELFTPGLDSSILDGITRQSVIEIARDLGYSVTKKTVTTGELLRADELFLCGTGAEVSPIGQVSQTEIGDGKPGPITTEIRETFFDVVRGRKSEYEEWLDYL